MSPPPDFSAGEPARAGQTVHAEGGFAYGVIGADMHVFGDGSPVYVLENWRPPPPVDPRWLRELPSRMLNARFAVVDFTGRQQELAELQRWRADGPRLAVRWLYGPGGQGKSRLADQCAREAHASGWKVVTATHGPGSVLPPPGSQDLRPHGAAGLLLLVDYADRWPLSHLTWLLSNSLLHRSTTPTRVLMLARTAGGWPGVRGALANVQAGTSTQLLEPLPDEPEPGSGSGQRAEMFTAARAGFAARLGATAEEITPPASLAHPDFGLPLAVHLAALVAVDAHLAGHRPPASVAGLTVYLLDREHAHWARLYGEAARDGVPGPRGFRTPPDVMNQAVFAAALTGPQPPGAGRLVLECLPARQPPAEQVIADHGRCYPPAAADRAGVLEPLHPDRLAEDFLALTLPGHDCDYPAPSWSPGTAGRLLGRGGDGSPPGWAPRAVTFLVHAAERWPHVGPEHLYPLLREDPRLAVDAGSAAMTALARLGDVPAELLDSIASHFPGEARTDLDTGIAHIAVRRAEQHELSRADSAFTRMSILFDLGVRLWRAGLYEQAREASEKSVRLARELAGSDPSMAPALASSLLNLAADLSTAGLGDEALAAMTESARLYRRLAGDDPVRHGEALALALDTLSGILGSLGRTEQSLEISAEGLAVLSGMPPSDSWTRESTLALLLHNHALKSRAAGRVEDALGATRQALEIRRRLAALDPTAHEVDLAHSLAAWGDILRKLGRDDEALAASADAVRIRRRLAESNPDARDPELATSLGTLGGCLYGLGLHRDAVAVMEEAVRLHRRLAASRPTASEPELARALGSLALLLSEPDIGRFQEALGHTQEALSIFHRLSTASPSAFTGDMADALVQFAAVRKNAHQDLLDGLSAAKRATALYGELGRRFPDAYAQKQAAAHLIVIDILDALGYGAEAAELRAGLGGAP